MVAHNADGCRLTTDKGICNRCEELDILTILKHRIVTSRGGDVIARLGKPEDWDTSACWLCQLFFDLREACKSHPQKRAALGPDLWRSESVKLVAYSTMQPLKYEVDPSILLRDFLDTTVLGLAATGNGLDNGCSVYMLGCIDLVHDTKVLQEDRVQAREVVHNKIDWKILGDWLRSCETLHGQGCGLGVVYNLENAWMIDCSNMVIVPAVPGSRYTALSYVWGIAVTQQSQGSGPHHLDAFPRTVRDAFTVTRSLGLRYIWIDRYCIKSSSAEHKGQQIRQMHRIYEQAYVVIVAAAGADIDFGIPGVGARSRLRQPQVRINNNSRLLSTLSVINRDVPFTTWNSRGWTFQETALARRRLIFTERQVYFECQDSHACESMYDPNSSRASLRAFVQTDDLEATRSGQTSRYSMVGAVGRIVDEKQAERDLLDHINTYARRQLTYQSDALDAFTGMMGRYQEVKFRRFHHGMPYIHQPTTAYHASGSAFLDLVLNLNAANDGFSTRRSGFPSWSWAGWRDGSIFPTLESTFEADLRVELTTGTIVRWEEFASSNHEASQWLLVEGQPVEVALTERISDAYGRRDGPFDGFCVVGDSAFDIFYTPWQSWTQEEEAGYLNTKLPALLMRYESHGIVGVKSFIAVLRPFEKGHEILGVAEARNVRAMRVEDGVVSTLPRKSFRIA